MEKLMVERDQNLMLVYAVEGYSQRHNLPEKEVMALFRKYGINHLIRKPYNALHTQDLDERQVHLQRRGYNYRRNF
jgi:hypothetical protein